jgi:60 kDa SS-A/Ro ribonucleoprotein
MAKYARHIANPATPQSAPAKAGQIKNRAGGYVFKIEDWSRLNRFLIIGNEGGTYYARESELTIENYDCVKRCLANDWKRTIDTIVSISDEGRATSNTLCVFALAVCSVFGSVDAKAYANTMVAKVARFSTDFFNWVTDVLTLKGNKKGKGFLRAIGRWYTEKKPKDLAYQICKYPSRSLKDGTRMGHADILRMARPGYGSSDGSSARNGRALTLPTKEHGLLCHYATHGVISDAEFAKRKAEESTLDRKLEAPGIRESVLESLKDSDLRYVWAHEKAKKASKKDLIKLIKDYRLTRESVPPELQHDPDVQMALLVDQPLVAMIRNLGQYTASGLAKPLSKATGLIIEKLGNKEFLKKARLHPMTIAMAQRVYSGGQGTRTSWSPVPAISDALESAFYNAFNYVEPTNQKYLVGTDVSGSMFWESGRRHGLLPAEAAAIVSMVIARTEKNYHLMAFSTSMVNLGITAKDSLSSVLSTFQRHGYGGTNVAAPVEHAIKNKMDVDMFCILTDNETWEGREHVFEALNRYRKSFNKNAKMAVLAFTATECSVADPSDPGMMDFVGLDSNVPRMLAEFATGKL